MTNKTIVLTSNTTAVASKTFLKNAMIFGSDEYYILKQFKAENPKVDVSARTIKKNPNKESNKNLTYNNMISHINELPNSAELLAEFNRQKRMSAIAKNKYRYILNWFKSACFENEVKFNEYRKSICPKETDSVQEATLMA